MGNILSYLHFTQCIRIGRQNHKRKKLSHKSQQLININPQDNHVNDSFLDSDDDDDFNNDDELRSQDDEKIIFYKPEKNDATPHTLK